MADEMSFQIPVPQEPEGRLVRVDEAERLLLENLQKCEGAYEEAMRNLAVFYSQVGDLEPAMEILGRLMTITDNPEKKADYLLGMGQLKEQGEDFEGAIVFYRQALSLEPVETDVWYLINNNLGYCLNQFGRHAEAEPYCRTAIRIDPERHNAYKNLGVAHEGQGRYTEAARCYVQAVQANAANRKALGHLEELLQKHSEVRAEIADIDDQLQQCRAAVEQAGNIRRKFEERLNQRMEGQDEAAE